MHIDEEVGSGGGVAADTLRHHCLFIHLEQRGKETASGLLEEEKIGNRDREKDLESEGAVRERERERREREFVIERER